MDLIMADNHDGTAGGKEIHDLFREIFQLHGALARIMDRVHEQAGLSTPQLKIMRTLGREGPATVPDIAALLGVSRQFVQTVCNELHGRNFLGFSNNPRHKRSRLVNLTDQGRAAFHQARKNEHAFIERAMPGLNPVRVADTCELLATIRKAVQQLASES